LYEIHAVETDPDDDKFLACALEAHAEYVVTEDRKDLLSLKEYRLLDAHVEIIDLPRFIQLL
jgi:predicted nucleic acid-binding protein